MRIYVLIVTGVIGVAKALAADGLPLLDAGTGETLRTFFSTYCKECHGPEKQKGDRRFDQLELPVAKADTLIELQDIIDQLNLGEMPPEKAKQHPETDAVRKVVEHLTKLVAVVGDEAEVGNDEVDAREPSLGKHKAGVDGDHVVAEANDHHVHSELAEPAQRDDLKNLVHVFTDQPMTILAQTEDYSIP